MTTRTSGAWGRPGTHLLPAPLRRHWAHRTLDAPVAAELDAPLSERYADVRFHTEPDSPLRLAQALAQVGITSPDVLALPLIPQPVLLKQTDLTGPSPLRAAGLSTRSENVLMRLAQMYDPKAREASRYLLGTLTLGDVLDVRTAGVLTVLDIASGLEQWLGDDPTPDTRHGPPLHPGTTPPAEPEEATTTKGQLLGQDDQGWLGTQADPLLPQVLSHLTPARAKVLLQNGSPDLRLFLSRAHHSDITRLPGLGPKALSAVRDAVLAARIREDEKRVASRTATGPAAQAARPAEPEPTTLEEELERQLVLLNPLAPPERIAALTARLGYRGEPPVTLAAAAAMLGVTREWMRQLQQKSTRWATPAPGALLQQVLELIELQLPAPSHQLQSSLQEAGLTSLTWHPESLRAVAAQRGITLDLDEQHGITGTREQTRHAGAILDKARRASDRNGAVHPRDLDRDPNTQRQTELLLELAPTAHPLGGGWFWLDHHAKRNRLVNISLRILHAHQPQDVAVMHEGADRAYRWRNSTRKELPLELPPEEVLRALYGSHPAFKSDSRGRVRARTPLDERDFGEEKSVMLDVLRRQPYAAMTRNGLINACADAGTLRSTAGVLITYAEFLWKVDTNIWGIRGTPIPDAYMRQLKEQAAMEAQAFDSGRLEGQTGNTVWFAQRINASILNSNVLPNTWHPGLLTGRRLHVIDGIDGENAGILRFTADGFNYGYSALFAKHRPAVGDVLRLSIDLEDGTTIAELGSDELLAPPPFLEEE